MGAVVSVFYSVNMCLNIVWFGGLCLTIAWLIFVWFIGLTSTSLFVLGALTGLVFAPIIPLSFALLLCGSAFGIIVSQKVAGKELLILDEKKIIFRRFYHGS